MGTDVDAKDRLSFAIFWAMWKLGVTPPKLGKAIGKSADTIRRWRDGETAPSVLDIGPLAHALGVTPDYFTNPPDVPDYPFGEYRVGFPGLSDEAAEKVRDIMYGRDVDPGAPMEIVPGSSAETSILEGLRRDQQSQQPSGRDKPAPSPKRRPRGSGAGRG